MLFLFKPGKANPYNDSTDSECDTEDEIKKLVHFFIIGDSI